MPQSLRYAVENEPFVGVVEASMDESGLADDAQGLFSDDIIEPNFSPSPTQSFKTPASGAPLDAADVTTTSRRSRSAVSLTVGSAAPRPDCGNPSLPSDKSSEEPHSPLGQETQELMTQPLFTALAEGGTVAAAGGGESATGIGASASGGEKEAADVVVGTPTKRYSNAGEGFSKSASRSGSQSLFSSAEKSSPPSSGEPGEPNESSVVDIAQVGLPGFYR